MLRQPLDALIPLEAGLSIWVTPECPGPPAGNVVMLNLGTCAPNVTRNAEGAFACGLHRLVDYNGPPGDRVLTTKDFPRSPQFSAARYSIVPQFDQTWLAERSRPIAREAEAFSCNSWRIYLRQVLCV